MMTFPSRRWVIAVFSSVLAFTSPAWLAAQDIGLPVGTRAEPVEVEDLDGNTVDLADFIGKQPVLLEFWATWCPLCEQLAPRIDAAHERFGDDVAFITVAVGINQSVRSVRGHLEDHPIPGLVVFDGDGRAARAFEAPGTSYVVVLDAEGRVAYTGGGGDQDIEGALARVVPSSSTPSRSGS